MNKRRSLLVARVAFAGVWLAGCASVPMTSTAEDATAKSFAVQPGQANIYVYRNETLGAAIPMTVALNGKVAGQTGPQTYFLFQVDPGTHEVSSIAENSSVLRLTTEAGKAYFVWQEVKMGLWMARSQLQQVSDDVGRKGVAECKRAQANF
jgi:ABC-type hemin transport system ATPase subunit